jgi:hypothetical protein
MQLHSHWKQMLRAPFSVTIQPPSSIGFLPSKILEISHELSKGFHDYRNCKFRQEALTSWLAPSFRQSHTSLPFVTKCWLATFPMKEPEIYQKLDTSKREIRLLEILPPQNDSDKVRCRLHTVSLDGEPEYIALSYVWGDKDDDCDRNENSGKSMKKHIFINNDAIPVMLNLVAALKNLRSKEYDNGTIQLSQIRFWADAICINQTDLRERSSQVQLMGAIYSTAKYVISWLGDDQTGELGIAFSLIGLMAKEADLSRQTANADWLAKYPQLFQPHFYQAETSVKLLNQYWASLLKLDQQPYWRRMWIIQELALSKWLVFMAGDCVLGLRDFQICCDFLERASKQEISRPKFIPKHLWYEFSYIGKYMILARDIRTYQKAFDINVDSFKYDYFKHSLRHRCSDPRDRIFALQGIVKNLYPPDYEKSTREVYYEYSRNWIMGTNELEVLGYSGIGRGYENPFALPTWVADWQTLSEHADLYIPRMATFQAQAGFEDLNAMDPRCTDDFKLHCSGIRCNAITEVLPQLRADNFTQVFSTLTGKSLRGGLSPLQAVLRTVVWDSDHQRRRRINICAGEPDDDGCELIYQILLWSLEPSCVHDGFRALGLLDHDEFTPLFYKNFPRLTTNIDWLSVEKIELLRSASLYMGGLLRSMRHTCCIFRTSRGSIGSSFPKVKAGDLICVLKGLPTPVILRPQGSKFTFVGICFLMGLMDGEAVELVRHGKRELETFTII